MARCQCWCFVGMLPGSTFKVCCCLNRQHQAYMEVLTAPGLQLLQASSVFLLMRSLWLDPRQSCVETGDAAQYESQKMRCWPCSSQHHACEEQGQRRNLLTLTSGSITCTHRMQGWLDECGSCVQMHFRNRPTFGCCSDGAASAAGSSAVQSADVSEVVKEDGVRDNSGNYMDSAWNSRCTSLTKTVSDKSTGEHA